MSRSLCLVVDTVDLLDTHSDTWLDFVSCFLSSGLGTHIDMCLYSRSLVAGVGNQFPDIHTDTLPRSRPLEVDSVVCRFYLRAHVSAVKEETTEFAEMKLH